MLQDPLILKGYAADVGAEIQNLDAPDVLYWVEDLSGTELPKPVEEGDIVTIFSNNAVTALVHGKYVVSPHAGIYDTVKSKFILFRHGLSNYAAMSCPMQIKRQKYE